MSVFFLFSSHPSLGLSVFFLSFYPHVVCGLLLVAASRRRRLVGRRIAWSHDAERLARRVPAGAEVRGWALGAAGHACVCGSRASLSSQAATQHTSVRTCSQPKGGLDSAFKELLADFNRSPMASSQFLRGCVTPILTTQRGQRISTSRTSREMYVCRERG